LRKKEDQPHQDGAKNSHIKKGQFGPEDFMDQGEEGGSDHRAKDGPHPAKEGHDNGGQRKVDVEGESGIDIILIGKMNGARTRDKKGAEDEGKDLVSGRVNAQGFCGLLIFTNGDQAEAKF
jgi:hypothetical protein